MKSKATSLSLKPLALITCLTLSLTACVSPPSKSNCDHGSISDCDQGSNNNLVINNVNIVDVAQAEIKTNQRVIVKSGVITEIRPMSVSYESEVSNTVDANGGYLTPGLIDMHVHAYDKSAFELSLSHGVTHVRVMNGVKQHLDWREEQDTGWLASGMSVSSPIVRSGEDSQPLNWTVNTAEEARAAIQSAKQQGYDLIKVYGSISKHALEAVLSEAEKLDIPIAKHGPHPVPGMDWRSLNGMQSLEHVEDIFQGLLNFKFDQNQLVTVISKLKDTQVPVTPTLHIFWQLTQLSQHKQGFVDELPLDYTSSIIAWEAKNNQVARWLNSSEEVAQHNRNVLKFLKQVTGQLHKSNVPLLVGSDAGVLLSPHGLSTHNELRLMRESGLDDFTVLRAATLNPAIALKMDDKIGQIKVGLQADFILTEGNPAEDIELLKTPKAVVKAGLWLSEKEMDLLREKTISSRSWWQELWVLLTNY